MDSDHMWLSGLGPPKRSKYELLEAIVYQLLT